MKVTYGIGKVKETFKNAVLVIGVFDGLHLGHQKLINTAIARAKAIKGETVVLTFAPHPVHVLNPQIYLPYIVSLSYRMKLLERLGVARCVVVRFSKKFSQMSPENFIKKYIGKVIAPKEVFVGDDFRFGQDRSGTLDYFKDMGERIGFKLNSVTPLKGGKGKMGSSVIRQLIMDGHLDKAQKYLGREVSIMAKVVRGDARGKTLGFPTANLSPKDILMPPVGVYAVKVEYNGKCYFGMANVGRRPSFKSTQNRINLEVHLFDFSGNLYDKEVIVYFVKKIREEVKFENQDDLIAQLKKDERKARLIYSKQKTTP